MYAFLGWLNVAILGILILPYCLRMFFRYSKWRQPDLIQLLSNYLRKMHKSLGLILIVSGAVHGYLALAGFRLHTGSLLLISIVVTVVLGAAFYGRKKRAFLRWHRVMMVVTVALLALHLLFPGAIYYLFN